jgi:hypothetical protein
MRSTLNRSDVFLAGALYLTAAVTAIYWLDFYFGSAVSAKQEEWYRIFQRAFLPADAWMALCATFAATGLLLGRPFGAKCGLLAGSALVFLALMDITFNAQNGLYPLAASSNAMRLEILINVWTLALGGAVIAALWSK